MQQTGCSNTLKIKHLTIEIVVQSLFLSSFVCREPENERERRIANRANNSPLSVDEVFHLWRHVFPLTV